jgi:hypothetical protein
MHSGRKILEPPPVRQKPVHVYRNISASDTSFNWGKTAMILSVLGVYLVDAAVAGNKQFLKSFSVLSG